jgi:polyhydroxyalkanoate synthesis regulator phasin
MTRIQKLVAGGIVLLAIGGAGAAVAATKLGSPEQESRAVVNDAARQLGVSPERLSNALKTAMKNRIDAAVEAGRLSKEEGDRLKAGIDQRGVPMLGPGFHRKRHLGFHHHKLDAAATYLGMTEAAIHEALANGKTLAQLARDRNKTVDGLVDALVAESRKRIDQAVEDGRLTRAQANEFVEGLRARVTDLVNGRFPRMGRGPRFHRFHEPRGEGAAMLRPAF